MVLKNLARILQENGNVWVVLVILVLIFLIILFALMLTERHGYTGRRTREVI